LFSKQHLVLLLLMCKYTAFMQAQDTKASQTRQNYAREIQFFAGPAGSTIKNENIARDKYALRQWCLSPEFGISYLVPAGEQIAYSAGLEFNQFKSQVLYRGYFRSEVEKKDRRGSPYIPVMESNYTSRLSLTTLDVPVSIRARFRVMQGLQAFIEGGVRLSALLSASQTLDGYLSKKGLYFTISSPGPYSLMVEDSASGFGTIKYDKQRVSYKTANASVSAFFGAGMQAWFSAKYFMSWQATALVGLTDLASAENGDYVNVFDDRTPYTKTTATKFSLRVGIGMRLR